MKRNGILAEAIRYGNESAKRDAERWQINRACVRTIDEDHLPHDTQVTCSSWGITIYIPWSLDNLQAIRKALGNNWDMTHTSTNDDGSMHRSYRFIDETHRVYCSLSVVMDAGRNEPGTCRKVEVGEEVVTYTRKKYKVVCTDEQGEVSVLDGPTVAAAEA